MCPISSPVLPWESEGPAAERLGVVHFLPSQMSCLRDGRLHLDVGGSQYALAAADIQGRGEQNLFQSLLDIEDGHSARFFVPGPPRTPEGLFIDRCYQACNKHSHPSLQCRDPRHFPLVQRWFETPGGLWIEPLLMDGVGGVTVLEWQLPGTKVYKVLQCNRHKGCIDQHLQHGAVVEHTSLPELRALRREANFYNMSRLESQMADTLARAEAVAAAGHWWHQHPRPYLCEECKTRQQWWCAACDRCWGCEWGMSVACGPMGHH